MRKLFIIFLLMTAMPAAAFAQTSGERRGWGYGFVGLGVTNAESFATAGGGGERLLYGGLGIGGEIGYLSSTDSAGNGLGLGSVNLAYHFNHSGRVAPFVTGGASSAFRSGVGAGGGNFGGGIQYWPKDHFGLRFEVRDHVFASDSPHVVAVRVGVTFR